MGSKNKLANKKLKQWFATKPKQTIEISTRKPAQKVLERLSFKFLIDKGIEKVANSSHSKLYKRKEVLYLKGRRYDIQIMHISNLNKFHNKDFPVAGSGSRYLIPHQSSLNSFKIECLECLLRLNEGIMKPGLVDEVICTSSTNHLRPSLLFLIKHNGSLFIIWESLYDLRATYVFDCNPDQIIASIQKLVDFIASNSFYTKRFYLTKSKKLHNVLSLRGKIKHQNSFEDWKVGLHRCFHN